MKYKFTQNWFDVSSKFNWDILFPKLFPSKILEIGVFEGRGSCYIIDFLKKNNGGELYCIDPWTESQFYDMIEVKKNFESNINLALTDAKNINFNLYEGLSQYKLIEIFNKVGVNYFDFIYIDGNHCAPEVLIDAILSFNLLSINGVIGFDDYLWCNKRFEYIDILKNPKIAIDAFTTIFYKKISIINSPNSQTYIKKISD
jgi:predicted O-methyltransferase YrrM